MGKVTEYVYECDWTDRGTLGWIVPVLKCDDFLKRPIEPVEGPWSVSTEPAPKAEPLGIRIISQTPYRSSPQVNQDCDMVRIVLTMPRNEWPKLKKLTQGQDSR